VVKLALDLRVKIRSIRTDLTRFGKTIFPAKEIIYHRELKMNQFIAPGLSRIEFKNAHQGLFDRAPIPTFDAMGFEKNLENITASVNDYKELSDRIADAIGTFIWQPEWFSLAVFDPRSAGSKVIMPCKMLPALPIKDLGFDRPGSILDHSAKERRLIYLPDARFEGRDSFYYIRVPEDLNKNELQATDAKTENIDTDLFARTYDKTYKHKDLFPISMVISPIIAHPEKVLGLYIAGYSELSLFKSDERTPDKELGYNKLRYFYLLSEAASRVIDILLKKGIFPQV
jgi:hypothetical protein